MVSKVYRGKVKWFQDKKGFGFIAREDGESDVFCHFKSIVSDVKGRKTLKRGQLVEFEIGESEKGFHAERLKVIA